MKIFNTLNRRLEEFVPIEAPQVRLYTCGPTVYDFAHIGNFRAYIFEDILRRYLKFSGFRVTQVMNLTDVDDKTIRGSRAAGIPLNEFTRKFKDAFFRDLKELNVEPAEHYPAATDFIPEMIALIERLLASGHAYRSEDGSIYFSIRTFPEYGKLAHLDRAGLREGARVDHDEYSKESLSDFALWKAWDPADGDVGWESPWGRGRPGWHIECSAMSMRYLGESFDLHTGGIDNMFPHHENEIAQSEAATGKPFVRYWMHCAHLIVNGEKMSKSLGNFFTLRQVLEKGYTGREIRYVLLAAQYRQTLNFTFDVLNGTRAALKRLDEFRVRLDERAAGVAPGAAPEWAARARVRFVEALDDDLNMSEALGALFDMAHEGHRVLNEGSLAPAGAAAVCALLDDLDRVLGVLRIPEEAPDAAILALVEQRKQARLSRNWKESDRVRDELAALGWEVRDAPDGQKLRKRRNV